MRSRCHLTCQHFELSINAICSSRSNEFPIVVGGLKTAISSPILLHKMEVCVPSAWIWEALRMFGQWDTSEVMLCQFLGPRLNNDSFCTDPWGNPTIPQEIRLSWEYYGVIMPLGDHLESGPFFILQMPTPKFMFRISELQTQNNNYLFT